MPFIIKGANSFKTEQKFYEKKKTELLKKSNNKFVLIKKEKILGIYDSAEEAYEKGLDIIGNVPMFIKRVTEKEPQPLLMGIL